MKSASDLLACVLVAASALLACSTRPAEGLHAEGDAGSSAAAVVDSNRCASCHMPEFNGTTHPPHPGARPTACAVCHTQSGWHPWRVDHPGWPLTGAHLRAAADKNLAGTENQVKCFWCHRGDAATFKVTKKDCMGCHAEDREKEDAHDAVHAEYPETCETCHSDEAWKPAKRPAGEAKKPGGAREPEEEDAGAHEPAPPVTRPTAPRPTPPVATLPTAPRPTAPKPTAPKPPRPTPTAAPTTPDVVTRPSGRR